MDDQNNPFIERPDEQYDDENILYCWVPGNMNRECNGACVAFEPQALNSAEINTCKALNIGKSIALSFARLVNLQNSAGLKAVVESLPQPPKVK
jgi:hypothetical protein